ncbi:MAG: hypothetical protein U9R56_06030, partial [candidate division Zixibacteria bacterium]|nr:hypothetical protein [candidate division Zixibacteria bacterium]
PEKYRYRAVFEKDGRELKTSKGQLLVESFSIEEYDQSGDPAGLTAIAKLSGGKYYHMRQFDEAMASLDLSSVDVHEKREFNLWGRFWLLAVLIGALAIEWMLRKINQLV